MKNLHTCSNDISQEDQHQEEEELQLIVEKAIRRERDALLALCRKIAKNVLIRARFLYKGDMADAEDIAQDALIRICEKIHTLKEPKAFSAWMNSVILNEVRQYQRRVARYGEVLYLDEYAGNIVDENEENLPQVFQLREEESRIIKEIIDRLSDRQREAIVIHYFEGMNVTETAEIMGIPHQNVSLYLKRGREKIRRELVFLSQEPKLSGFHALAAAPVGAVASQALTQEAGYMAAVSDVWAEKAVDSFIKHVEVKSSAAMIEAKRSLPRIFATFVVVAVVVVSAIGLHFVSGNASASNPSAVLATDLQRASMVVFSGGDAVYERLNPTKAVCEITDETLEITIKGWVITEEGGSETLYAGGGGLVESPFAALLGGSRDGEYMLTFSLEDGAGRYYMQYKNFQILSTV